jgi:hypothetical protein
MLQKIIKSFNESVLCTNHKRYPVLTKSSNVSVGRNTMNIQRFDK